MSASRSISVITDKNVEEERARINTVSPSHAAALDPGCRLWEFTNAEGFRGEIILWPDGRAALVSTAGSHWGEWDARARQIRLDDGDVYNDEGGVGEDA